MRQCIIYSFVAVRTSFGVTGQILGRWSRFVPPRGSYTDFVELFHELEFLQYRLEVRTAELSIPSRYQFSAKLSFQDLQDSPERRSPDFIYDIWTRLYRTNWLPLSPQNGICISRRFYLVSISNSCPVSLSSLIFSFEIISAGTVHEPLAFIMGLWYKLCDQRGIYLCFAMLHSCQLIFNSLVPS